jgi:hypothetical protein
MARSVPDDVEALIECGKLVAACPSLRPALPKEVRE